MRNVISMEEKKDGVLLVRGDQLTPEAVNWLWPGWLAAGKMHILGGQAGTAKTTLAMALGAILTRGGRWPDGVTARYAGDVVIWSGEDDPSDTLAPRLIAAGADMTRVHIISGMVEKSKPRSFDPASDMELLAAALRKIGNVRLLIVDPIVSAITGDSHKNSETRRGLQPLVDLAASIKCALLGITHFSKGTQGREPIDRITGSLAFAALARIVMVCAKETGDSDSDTPRRLLMRAKSNLGPDDGGVTFDLLQTELAQFPGVIASRVQWGERIEGSAREMLAQADSEPESGGALRAAQDWLRAFLEEPKPMREVRAAADAFGHSWATVRRAQRELGVESRKSGAAWVWHLPDKHQGAQPTRSRCSTQKLEHLEHLEHLEPNEPKYTLEIDL